MRLERLIRLVNERLANASSLLTELSPLVGMAADNAHALRGQADVLDRLLTNTTHLAGKALIASRRFADIAKTLNDALRIAIEAERIAMDSMTQVTTVVQQDCRPILCLA